MGTDQSKFPTTRQTRTTVAPTEYVIHKGPIYDVTVVFKPLTEIKGYVDEILRDVITRHQKDKQDDRISKNLRQTSDQRFRLYYLLSTDFTQEIVDRIISLAPLVETKVQQYQIDFPEDQEELGIFVEFALNELGDSYTAIRTTILEEISARVRATCAGHQLDSTTPYYKFEQTNKDVFVNQCKAILSSEANSISPLIEYARIRGNLVAKWLPDGTEAVIVDGEGIGHDTKEAGQLSSRHYDHFYCSDAILLIEESKKPFVAGGKSALRSIFERGYRQKLLVLFTKLDEVEPYDIDGATIQDQIDEVNDGLENVLASLKEEGQEIDLTENSIFYLGGLKEDMIDDRAMEQISAILVEARKLSTFTLSFVKPEYDFEMLSGYLVESTKQFNELYRNMLYSQHWKTIQAFNRRMDMGIDGFRMFMPITDFEEKINDEIKAFISNPIRWEEEVTDKLKEQSLDKIRREFNKLILEFARHEIIAAPRDAWRTAYLYSGSGSTYWRRADIESIFRHSVPPNASSANAKEFKDHVKDLLAQAIANCEKA
jgi:hypothetical protein